MVKVGTVLLEALESLRCKGWGEWMWRGSAFLPGSEVVLCFYIRPKLQGAGRQGDVSE